MPKWLKVFLSILILIVVGIFLSDTQRYMANFFEGLSIWAKSVLPALFPFIFLSKIFVSFDVFSKAFNKKNVFSKMLNSPPQGAYVMLISLLCGYPIGAKMISELFLEQSITKTQAEKLCTFCLTAGPIFVVGTVGTMLNSTIAAALILTSHITANLVNGVLFRDRFVDNTKVKFKNNTLPEQNLLGSAMLDSLNSILAVGGFVAIFYLLCNMLYGFLPSFFLKDGQLLTAFAFGILEMTNGCLLISQSADLFTATVLCSGLISFGGLCVLLQSMAFLAKCGIKIGTVATIKVSHSALSTIICFALAFICRQFNLL